MKLEDFLLDDTFLAWHFKTDNVSWSAWEARRKQDPVLSSQMDEAVRLIEAIATGNVDVPLSQQAVANARLMSRIQKWESERSREIGSPVRSERRGFFWSAVAASVSLIAVLGYWILKDNGDARYYSQTDAPQRIELADGSVVNLNAHSSLKTSFVKGKDREVWLDGEGYFEVTKQQSGAKFIVHSAGLDIEVLGTQFNVKGDKGKTEVVLESGKVLVSRPENSTDKMQMEPGEMAELVRKSGSLTKRDVNTKIYTSWKEGKVIFENAQIDEIVQLLEERYDLKVEVEEGSKLGEFNGIFPSDDHEIVITALEKTYPRRIVRGNGSILIKK